ncbi:MAG: class I SAM-dependent methyltransferase [Planctomycetota bacterium]|jgi:serine/threonine-protein kinase HipA
MDLGCGAGASTLVLARALGSPVTAVDACGEFIEELRSRAAEAGVSHLVRAEVGDFARLDVPPRSIDLLWSEGAIYNLGWAEVLALWSALVKPGGFLALSEATWLVTDPPEEVSARWSEWYPGMGTVESNRAAARETGLDVVDSFALPASAWRDFYAPLLERCEALRDEAERDADLRAVIEETRTEADIFERHGDSYGYVFYVLRVPG